MESAEPVIRVPEAFDDEFADGSRQATEVLLNLGVLLGAVRSAVEGLLAAEGLPSLAAFNVVTVLAGDPAPLLPSIVAQRMMVTRATMTGLIDSLERRGLVERVAGAVDARTRPAALTPLGREIAARAVPAMHRFERDLMCALSGPQLNDLLMSVARLQRRMTELAPDARFTIR